MYTLKEAQLISALKKSGSNRRVNSFERQFNTADAAPNPNAITIATQPGGDFFVDQFSVNILTYYFTVAAGVYTNVAAAALAASLKTKLAAFIFGYSDFTAGFAKAQSLLPVAVWGYEAPFSYRGVGTGATSFGNIDANVRALLQVGDVVQPFTAITAGPVNTAAFVVMRLSNGYYANMLNALGSDTFSINKVRYQLTDPTLLGQFNNPIQLINISLFGAAKTDNVDPTAYKQPQQFQAGIIDIGINQLFYKAIGWGIYTNYDSVSYTLSIFVNKTTRLK